MSQIRIVKDPSVKGPFEAFGTQVFLDGHEVRFCRGVSVSANVDELVTANLELIASDNFEVDMPAQVNVTIVVPDHDSGVLEETTLQDGTRRFKWVAK